MTEDTRCGRRRRHHAMADRTARWSPSRCVYFFPKSPAAVSICRRCSPPRTPHRVNAQSVMIARCPGLFIHQRDRRRPGSPLGAGAPRRRPRRDRRTARSPASVTRWTTEEPSEPVWPCAPLSSMSLACRAAAAVSCGFGRNGAAAVGRARGVDLIQHRAALITPSAYAGTAAEHRTEDRHGAAQTGMMRRLLCRD